MIKEYYLKDGTKKFMFQGYYGTNPITGKKIITTRRGFNSVREAKIAEARFSLSATETKKALNVNITFKDFFHEVWWDAYINGQTNNHSKPPTKATIAATNDIFRLHLMPLFGDSKISYLNENKSYVVKLLSKKAEEYANFKTIRSYFVSIFDLAEEFDYIEVNKLEKSVRRIKSIKKQQLKELKEDDELYLSIEQLTEWLDCTYNDYKNEYLDLKDYTLFLTTFFLSDRKSESYALRWKNIDFANSQITINRALDKFGNIKSTKGEKQTIFTVPNELMAYLKKWKIEQHKFLTGFNIVQDDDQFVFTYIDIKGNVNKPLHVDYLNYRMQAIQKRHPHLAKCTPHKLRHTGATLARQAGIDITQISEALTHSDTDVTKTYINSPNVIPITVGEIAFNQIKQKES